MVAGSPFMCMRQTAQLLSRTASMAPGAWSACTSFTMEAPDCSAARITAGRRVSIETQRSPIFSSTGMTRASSSASETGAAPGRVDSPPMSMMSAPSSASFLACATAADASRKRPPSEKESGVMFTTPITSGLPSGNENLPQRSAAADFKGTSLGGCRRRRGTLGAAVARRRLLGVRARRLRWPRRLAGHDVTDLVGVDGLELEQRLGHRLDLVAVVLEELAREVVLLVDDAANLRIHLLHRLLGHVLVRGHRPAGEDLALVLAIDHPPHLVRHAPLRHHAARDIGGPLEVVGGAGGHLLHEQLFGNSSAEQHRDHVEEAIAVLAVAIGLRQLHRHAQRTPARADGHLVHRACLPQRAPRDRAAPLG